MIMYQNQKKWSLILHRSPKSWSVVTIIVILVSSLIKSSVGTISVMEEGLNETSVYSIDEKRIGEDSATAYNLEGRLIIAEPLDACQPVMVPPNIITLSSTAMDQKWILIVTLEYKNDRCSLLEKVRNAETAGYSAVIIHRLGTNDTTGVAPSLIGFDWLGVSLYSCLVGDYDGSELRDNFAYPNPFYLKFVDEPYFSFGFIGNLALLICLTLLLICVVLRAGFYIYSVVSANIRARVVERRRIRKTLLTPSQLRKLPVLKWAESIPQDTCSICLENFVVQDDIRVLPCSHVFHQACIDVWLLNERRKCPNCKRLVIFPNEHFSDSDSSSDDENRPLLRNQRENSSTTGRPVAEPYHPFYFPQASTPNPSILQPGVHRNLNTGHLISSPIGGAPPSMLSVTSNYSPLSENTVKYPDSDEDDIEKSQTGFTDESISFHSCRDAESDNDDFNNDELYLSFSGRT